MEKLWPGSKSNISLVKITPTELALQLLKIFALPVSNLKIDKIPKSMEKKQHHTLICSNFRGKIVDGTTITVHKFPANEYLKKTWVRRIRTVTKSFVLKKNSCLCSTHFEGGKMSNEHNVQSVFDLKMRKKLFPTSEKV